MSEHAAGSQRFKHGLTCFYLGTDLFAVSLQLVSEINRHIDLTPVRTAPEHVSGLVNLRGQIVTVIDLSGQLGLGDSNIQDASRLIVLKTNSELAQCHAGHLSTSSDKVGLLVDKIADVVNPTEQQLEPPPPNLNGVARGLMLGVCKTENQTIGILDAQRVLASSEIPH
ncbi:MAG: chemotaxis protein CheW [bacterium]|nr:chemotaxis protein CheW [bacterium]